MSDMIIHAVEDGDAKFWRSMKPRDFAVFDIATYARYAQVRGSAYRLMRMTGGMYGPKFVARKTSGKGVYPTHCVISCHEPEEDWDTVRRVEREIGMILERVKMYLETLPLVELALVEEPKGCLKAKPADVVVAAPVLELVG